MLSMFQFMEPVTSTHNLFDAFSKSSRYFCNLGCCIFREEIQNEIRNVKREYQQNKLKKDDQTAKQTEEEKVRSETFKEYDDEFSKYKEIKKTQLKKGAGREAQTLALLARFKEKLSTVKEKYPDEDKVEDNKGQGDNEVDVDGEDW